MRTLSEVNQRYKTQLDSLRTRLTAVTKEKCDNEDKVIKLSNELDRKVRVLCENTVVNITNAHNAAVSNQSSVE